MKKLHLGAVLFSILLVGVVVIAIGTGVLFGTADANDPTSPDESRSTDSDSTTVEGVSVHNRTANGVLYLDIAVVGDLDTERLGRSLERLYDDPTVNVSTIELVEVQRNVATVAIATDDRSRSTHVVNRVEQYLADTDGDEQSTVQTNESGSADGVCEIEDVFYQIDFVQGEVIENLRGPEGYYTPDELIRFAHGSSDQPIVRTSDGVFTTDRDLRRGVESQQITVHNGMATITFSIAAGHGPVELTLASYEKPGSGWSPETEAEQVLVDYDTETFASGGPYTLRVALPDAEAGPCRTTETTTTATLTDIPTNTTDTVDMELSRSTPVSLRVDWLSVYNGEERDRRSVGSASQAIFELGDVKPGDTGTAIIRLHNDAAPSYIWMGGELTRNDENGANEPERDVEANPGGEGDGELAENVEVTLFYAEHTGPGNYHVKKREVITSGSLAAVMVDLNDGIALDDDPDTSARDPYSGHETGFLVLEWELPMEVGNEVQSDSVEFTLEWFARQAHYSDGSGPNSDDN